jgi:hypothetical protein
MDINHLHLLHPKHKLESFFWQKTNNPQTISSKIPIAALKFARILSIIFPRCAIARLDKVKLTSQTHSKHFETASKIYDHKMM